MSAIVLFDGVCNFCEGSVKFIIEHDKEDYFKFAPLQSETGKKLLAEHNINKDETDSIVLIENGKAYTYSDAALNIAVHLDKTVSWTYFFIIVPKFIRDFVYKIIAKYRYKFFGKKDQCMVPTPDIREKFIEMN